MATLPHFENRSGQWSRGVLSAEAYLQNTLKASIFVKILIEIQSPLSNIGCFATETSLGGDHPQEPRFGIPAVVPCHDAAPMLCFTETCFIPAEQGKKLVVLAGQKKAVAIAVRNVSWRWRWSE
jgi:hypothetical protein